MPRVVAVAIRENAYMRAGRSVVDFMYGTEERTRITYVFALGLLVLGVILDAGNSNALLACVN